MADVNKDCVFRTCCAHELHDLTRSGWQLVRSYEVDSAQPVFEPIVGYVPTGRGPDGLGPRFYGAKLSSPCFHATHLEMHPPEGHTVRYVKLSARWRVRGPALGGAMTDDLAALAAIADASRARITDQYLTIGTNLP